MDDSFTYELAKVHNHAACLHQSIHSSRHYMFQTEEEVDEFKQRYQSSNIGHATEGEQRNASDRIYKLICMKRRMRAKALKK
jgi:hypothetical protein